MNILHTIETLGRGGAEQVLVTLLPYLSSKGHTVSVGVLNPPLDLKKNLTEAGISVFQLPAHNRWNIIAGARNISKLSKALDCDVVHANLFFPTLYLGVAKTFRMVEAASFVTYHNQVYIKGYFQSNLKSQFRRLIASVFDRFGIMKHFAVSTASAAHYKNALSLKEIELLPNPVDLKAVDRVLAVDLIQPSHQPSHQPSDRLSQKSFHIVIPGRLVQEKGHGVLIEALSQLKEASHNFTLTIAGEGPMRSEIEAQLLTSGLADLTEITGHVSHQDMLMIMRSADIVVVPSLFEGFGLTAAEALALEKPVIATHAGGLSEFVIHEKTGLSVTPGRVDELYAAIKRLSEDTEFGAKLGLAGKAHVFETFSPEIISTRLLLRYQHLV